MFIPPRRNPLTLEERVGKLEYNQNKESSHRGNVHERLDKLEHKYALNAMSKVFANHVNKIGEDICRNNRKIVYLEERNKTLREALIMQDRYLSQRWATRGTK